MWENQLTDARPTTKLGLDAAESDQPWLCCDCIMNSIDGKTIIRINYSEDLRQMLANFAKHCNDQGTSHVAYDTSEVTKKTRD